MNEFKQRLMYVGFNILFYTILIIFSAVIIGGLYLISRSDLASDLFVGSLMIILVCTLVFSVIRGIYWLFVEPFKNKISK